VKLFETAIAMRGTDAQLAPIQLTASGLAKNTEVWTGAADWPGINENCNGWTSIQGGTVIGISALGGVNGASFNGSICSQSRPIYCFQD